MAKLTKLETQIMEKFMALHRFRVAKTEEERQAAVKYAQEYCEKYKLNYKRQFSHLYWGTIYIIYSEEKKYDTRSKSFGKWSYIDG